jgi:hypothetical protein
MMRRVLSFSIALAGALTLTGCGLNLFSGAPERPAWRKQAEAQCMARGDWRALLQPAKLPDIQTAQPDPSRYSLPPQWRAPQTAPQFAQQPVPPGALVPAAPVMGAPGLAPLPPQGPMTPLPSSAQPGLQPIEGFAAPLAGQPSAYDLDFSTEAEDAYHDVMKAERRGYADDDGLTTQSIFPSGGFGWPRAIAGKDAPITPVKAIDGPGNCGADSPLKVSAVPVSGIAFSTPVPLTCPTTLVVGRWLTDVVQPAAFNAFGQPVRSLLVMGSYSCRTIMNNPRASMSEHAYANALDIAGFVLDDGTRISVRRHWRSGDANAAFLRAVHSGACGIFATTLGPDANAAHEDHFHVDMAKRRSGRSYCR